LVSLTATQIKNLVAHPVKLVDAPDEGYFILPSRVILSYHGHGATAYTTTGAGHLEILWGTNDWSTHNPVLDKTMLESTEDLAGVFSDPTVDVVGIFDTHAHLEAQDLMLSQQGASEYGTGTGVAQIMVAYKVVPIA
jgi:hypothetical protein